MSNNFDDKFFVRVANAVRRANVQYEFDKKNSSIVVGEIIIVSIFCGLVFFQSIEAIIWFIVGLVLLFGFFPIIRNVIYFLISGALGLAVFMGVWAIGFSPFLGGLLGLVTLATVFIAHISGWRHFEDLR